MLKRLKQLIQKGPVQYDTYRQQGFTVFQQYVPVSGSAKFVGSLRPFVYLLMGYLSYDLLRVRCETQKAQYSRERELLVKVRGFFLAMCDVQLIQQVPLNPQQDNSSPAK